MRWAWRLGILENPKWYPGLTPASPAAAFQRVLRQLGYPCPRPCDAGELDVIPSATPGRLLVTVPVGVAPGHVMKVPTADAGVVDATVPSDLEAGGVFELILPPAEVRAASAQGGAPSTPAAPSSLPSSSSASSSAAADAATADPISQGHDGGRSSGSGSGVGSGGISGSAGSEGSGGRDGNGGIGGGSVGGDVERRQDSARCADGTRIARQPHVVLLMADDLGFTDLGYAGSTVVKTPTIDTLARHAVHLTNFFAPTWCAPSRAALMSGRAPWSIGVTAALMEPPPREVMLLPELLGSVGYRTALVGKLHLIPDRKAHPAGHPKVGHGLDHFYGFVGGMTGYWERSPSWQRNGERLVERGYTTHLITKEAVEVVASHPLHRHASTTTATTTSSAATATAASGGGNGGGALPPWSTGTHTPLFLWVSWTAPHRPMEATPEEEALYPESLHPKVRTYAAMVPRLPGSKEF